MQAIEFQTQPQNGVIKLPSQFLNWDKPMRVILLFEEISPNLTKDLEPSDPLFVKQSHQKTKSSKPQKRPLGLLEGKAKCLLHEEFKITDEEFLHS